MDLAGVFAGVAVLGQTADAPVGTDTTVKRRCGGRNVGVLIVRVSRSGRATRAGERGVEVDDLGIAW